MVEHFPDQEAVPLLLPFEINKPKCPVPAVFAECVTESQRTLEIAERTEMVGIAEIV